MTVRELLFVELLGGIGDVLLALPAVHALARAHRAARVTVATFAPGSALLAADPHIAEVVEAKPGPPDQHGATVAALLAERPWDLVVSDTNYGGIPDAIARSTAARTVTNLWRDPPPDELIDLRFLRLLADEGLVAAGDRQLAPQLILDPGENARAQERVGQALPGRPRVLLVPESGMRIKEWGVEPFRALAAALDVAGVGVVVPTGASRALARAVASASGHAWIVPPLPLASVAAIAGACDGCVAGDTGLGRIAAASGVPTVCLFGPSWAGRFGLRPPHRSLQSPLPCDVRDPLAMTEQSCWYSGRCVFDDRRSCTEDLRVEQILAELRKVRSGTFVPTCTPK